jgi:hypothetical protein
VTGRFRRAVWAHEAQQYLNGLYATIGLALIVTWRINDNRKH